MYSLFPAEKIYFAIDQNQIWINKENIVGVKYFETVLSNPSVYGLGTVDDPILLDLNLTDIENILEYIRNMDRYQLTDQTAYIWNLLMEPTKIPKKSDFFKINIGTHTFVTTISTLTQLSYFHALINVFKCKIPDFLDRSGPVFKFLLAKLRNCHCEFPPQYQYELDFFGHFTDGPNKITLPLKSKLTNMHIPSIEHDLFRPHIPEEVYLVGNPQITFNKITYRRFCYYESGDIIVEGSQKDNIINFQIPKENIDLITGELYLFLSIPTGLESNHLELDVIDKIELKCDDVIISSNSGKLNHLLSNNFYGKTLVNDNYDDQCVELFFYNKNIDGLALPNLSIDKPVIVQVTMKHSTNLVSKLFLEYNKLYEQELGRFQNSHEYLLPEWKEKSFDFDTHKFTLPIQMCGLYDLFFFEILPEDNNDQIELLLDLTLLINSKPRKYLNPLISEINYKRMKIPIHGKNVYMLTFSKCNPAQYTKDGCVLQPSGHIPISETDICTLQVDLNCIKGQLNIYARTYNILRIQNKIVSIGYKQYMK